MKEIASALNIYNAIIKQKDTTYQYEIWRDNITAESTQGKDHRRPV